MPRARLLFFIILAYACVLNFFVFRLFIHNHPGALKIPLSKLQSIKLQSIKQTRQTQTQLHLLAQTQENQAAPERHAGIEANCVNAQPVIAIVNTGLSTTTRKMSIPPLLTHLRDLLGQHPMRIVLLGNNHTLSDNWAIWCSSVHMPCTTIFLPPSTDLLDLHTLKEPLLQITPCLDDLVLLQDTLRIDHMFLQNIRRSTQFGKVTCLFLEAPTYNSYTHQEERHLPYCPTLAYRLPRSFLWQILDEQRGDVLALAGERGMLGSSVSLVRSGT